MADDPSAYHVVIVNDDDQFAATAPDLPGVFATGATREETEEDMREAIRLYVQEVIDAER